MTDQGETLLQREAKLMNLEKLLEAREVVPEVSFPVPDDELLARFERMYCGALSDVLREWALLDQALPGYLKPLRPERTVAGFAFTVKSAPNTRISGELTYRAQMLGEMQKNTLVCWDASGDTEGTMWGGVMTATVHAKGVRGAVVDGGVRDTHQIMEKDFPVFYRYRSPNGSLGRCLITHYQIPIKIGNVFIRPGDVVVGDIDGVVVIPRAIAYEVLLRAEAILENEKRIFSWVEAGETVEQITAKGGYF
ncbi:RraA family protein [Xanthobacteraceae bacterium Astr-EGSB]|uniref:RraA family protein n=1 Tax=Astrobacterium formosum TaxID=3069710 RepID=UPI0027B6DF3B|nr:RraA family protein [Xanthobacteraceae bacterium Astr-EGSB]